MASSPDSSSPLPTTLPDEQQVSDIEKFRKTKDCQQLISWIKGEHTKAKNARTTKQRQWYMNMAMFYGNQWMQVTGSKSSLDDRAGKLYQPSRPYYVKRRSINRTRSFVRTEMSKFLSQLPIAQAVPATSTDEDLRAAYAAEQVWSSLTANKKLRTHFSRATWWQIVTGNGFIKTWWDQSSIYDKATNETGDIKFGSVTPFHLFVPDLREQEIEDQPYVINAYTKPLEWCEAYYADELKGVSLKASTTSADSIIEGGYLNLSTAKTLDSCTIYETWIKPGAHKLLPNGGVVISIDDVLVSIMLDGFPYEHNQYPFTKFEHIPTATFYADSPLVDTNQLQREYNELRSDISEFGRRMARPQWVAQKGSVVPSKMTNEPGLVIEYRPGTQAPQQTQLTPLPQYFIDQQDRINTDWEDVTGQHDVSRGSAPSGVTAGTAINFLQEADNQFLTPQHQSIEDGFEKIASQAVALFVQYVDLPRKIKTVGADGTFDTIILSGSDVKNGTDIRMEPGSSVAQSQAAKQAQVTQMFTVGMIDQPTALKLMEMGGVQKVLDVMSVAERKAQRENIKMKLLTPDQIQQHEQAFAIAQLEAQMQQIQMQPQMEPYMPGPAQPQLPGALHPAVPNMDPSGMQISGVGGVPGADPTATGPADGATAPGDPTNGNPSAVMPESPTTAPGVPAGPSPVISVDDFDEHQVHIVTHNKFRMSQEFEALDPAVKQQFALHVKLHEQALMKGQLQQFFAQIPSDGSDGADSGSMDVPVGGQGGGAQQPPGATLSANGAVPDPSQSAQSAGN